MIRLLVLAGVCVLMAWGQKKPVTLEVMHAQPAFAELAGMEWSADGARFAWIAGGQVKVYADGVPASMPDGQGQLSHFSTLGVWDLG